MAEQARWERLVSIAIVGSDRAPGSDDTESAVFSPFASDPAASAERRLLNEAAGAWAYLRSGAGFANRQSPALEPAQRDERPVCSTTAFRLLRQLLSSRDMPLVQEWLHLVGQAGKTVPGMAIPALLNVGRQFEDIHEAIEAVVGNRGTWVARQNPDWDWILVPEDPAARWESSSLAERRRQLRGHLRRDPAVARTLIQSTWRQDSAEARKSFVTMLGAALQPGDESFLETALDDPSKGVRETASTMLAGIPESRLAQRMVDRLESLIDFGESVKSSGFFGRFTRSGNSPQRLEIRLPESCPPDLVRDGVDPKPAIGSGQRSSWLQGIVSAVPLGWWTARFHCSPEELFVAARASDHRATLLAAWKRAIELQQNAEWAEAWIRSMPEPIAVAGNVVGSHLDPVARLRLIDAWLERTVEVHRPKAYDVISFLAVDLGPQIVAKVGHRLRSELATVDQKTMIAWKSTLERFADVIPVDLFAEESARWTAWIRDRSAWDREIGFLIDRITLRHSMHEEISR